MGTSGNGYSSHLHLSIEVNYSRVLGIKNAALEAVVSDLRRVAHCQSAASGLNSSVHLLVGKMLARKGDPGHMCHRSETVFLVPGI